MTVRPKKAKKEIRILNVSLNKDLHDEFEQFCLEAGQNKTVATERAIRMYIDTMRSGKGMPHSEERKT